MTDLSALHELAQEGQDLLDNKAFNAAVLSLRQRWFGEAMDATSSELKLERIAMIKALVSIPTELKLEIAKNKRLASREAAHA